MGIPVWDAAADAGAVPGARHRRAVRRSGASCRRWSGCASAPRTARRSASCSRRCCARPATSTRSRPSGRSRPRAGSRTSQELVGVAREYDAQPPPARSGALDEFLQQVALLADADTRRDDEGLVTLMTLHNAKGLEYPIVFMIGCEEGVFPHSRALDEGGLEEERRLAYVGITRAMRDLYLTYARRRNVFGAPDLRPALALPRRDPARADRPARPQRRRGRPPGGRRPGRVVGDGRGRVRGPRSSSGGWAAASAAAAVAEGTTARAPCSASATTSSTPRSARASSPASSPAGSSSCASRRRPERKLMADYAPIRKR